MNLFVEIKYRCGACAWTVGGPAFADMDAAKSFLDPKLVTYRLCPALIRKLRCSSLSMPHAYQGHGNQSVVRNHCDPRI